MEILELIGKALFSTIFIASGISHFKNFDSMAGYARAKKLLFADLNVMVSGVILLVAPVFFVLGFLETLALASLAVFLLLTSFIFHAYWKEEDPMSRMNEQIAFNKNISLFGAIIIILALI
jgi:putative oxidoreductase